MPQMRSRREQVDAHRFITSRMNQALVLANPDSVERPLRRIGVSIFASVMIMVLIFGGFAIAALLGKGNDAPKLNHIIVEKGTGTVYVYRTVSGGDPTPEDPAKLWPVTNYTSALLMLQPYGDAEVPRQELKPTSLLGEPLGFTVGIEGVPRTPPDPEALLQEELWHVCSSPVRDDRAEYLAQVVVADPVDMPDPRPLADDWMFASDPNDDAVYLLAGDRRYLVPDLDAFATDLQLDPDKVMPVKEEVLNTLTRGADLVPPPIADKDEPSGVVTHDQVELLYGRTVSESGTYYILIKGPDGLPEFAKIGEVMQRLLQPETGETVPIKQDLLSEHGGLGEYEPTDFPRNRNEDTLFFDGRRPAVCSVFDPSADPENAELTVGYFETAPEILTDAAESITMKDGEIVAAGNPQAQTVLPPGHAALVNSQPAPGQNIRGISYLIDGLGYKYGLVDEQESGRTKGLLGYGSIEPVGIPQTILSIIQTGVSLDPREARSKMNPESEPAPTYDPGDETTEAADGE